VKELEDIDPVADRGVGFTAVGEGFVVNCALPMDERLGWVGRGSNIGVAMWLLLGIEDDIGIGEKELL